MLCNFCYKINDSNKNYRVVKNKFQPFQQSVVNKIVESYERGKYYDKLNKFPFFCQVMSCGIQKAGRAYLNFFCHNERSGKQSGYSKIKCQEFCKKQVMNHKPVK